MHIYEQNGNKYPSVTTIISSLASIDTIKWANSLGFRHIDYEKELDRYANRGTLIHDLLRGEVDPSYTPNIVYKDDIQRIEALGFINRFRNFIKLYRYETLYTEKTIISESLGYAGTLDWVAKFNGQFLLLNDFKTSSKVKSTHLLQLGGYNNLLKEIGINVDGASIILCNTKVCTMYPINKTKLEEYSQAFNILAKYYIYYNRITKAPDNKLVEALKSTKS